MHKNYALLPADILVVDDHPHNLELLRTVLEAEGHRVHMEQDGPAALRAVSQTPFDIALVDIRMPGMSGYELCAKLKENPHTRSMPVIFLSALDDASDKVQAFDSGGDDYIVKPFKVAEVLARVRNQLRNASIQKQANAKYEALRQRNAELLNREDHTSPRTPGGSKLSFVDEAKAGSLLDGKYELEELIGHGGFGDVYRARHVILDRPVAVKLLRGGPLKSSRDAARFRAEGISACRVDHPNAVAIWDAGLTPQGVVYLVMELLQGHSLRAELQERGALPAQRVLHIARVVADVLSAAHAAGVIHRDVKPDNVFLHIPRDGAEIIKVVDFGIAKLVDSTTEGTNTGHGQVIGTPDYLAPERLMAKPYDGRSDVYALGCMLFELLSGRLPFVPNKQEPWAVATQHLAQEPPELLELCPWLAPEVAALVHAMLEKRAASRPFAAEVLGALDRLLELIPQEELRRATLLSAPPDASLNTDAPTLHEKSLQWTENDAD